MNPKIISYITEKYKIQGENENDKKRKYQRLFQKKEEGKDFLHSGLQCSPAALSINDA